MIPTSGMPVHCQVPSLTLVSHCIFGILVFKDGEVYLHACFFLVSPTYSRMSGSIWTVRLGWHWRCHWQWTPITFETTVWGRGREPGWLRSLVPPSPVMPLASGRLSGCSLVIRTVVSGHIFWMGISLGIQLKRLLGQWIRPGTSWSSHLYSIIWYILGNGPFALLYCHWVGGEVGQFSYPCPSSCEEEWWHP